MRLQEHPGWKFSLNLVSTITPTLLNEFSIGPSHTLSLAESVNGNVSRGKNGLENLGLLFPLGPDESIPDLGFGGLDNVNLPGSYFGGTPWKQANTTINVNDNVTWVLHNHTLKGGISTSAAGRTSLRGAISTGSSIFKPGRRAVVPARGVLELARWEIHLPAL